MPQSLTSAPPGALLRTAMIGFHGKIPARGDFVRAGLPRAFADPWDLWLQHGLAASRTALGEDWLPAWMEAPVWRFVLSPGLCGPDAVIGLWMPSVDCVGRHFPLTLAAVVADADPAMLVANGGGFLAAAEDAGRAALECDLAPDDLALRLGAAVCAAPSDPGIAPGRCPAGGALWWTAGAPLVPPAAFASQALPDEAAFAAMLDARVQVPGAAPPAA